MGLLTVLCLVLTFLRPLQPFAVAYIGSGLVVGAVIGWFALRHTEFAATPEGYFYTPHLYIGIAITALFIGRLLYRVVLVYGTVVNAAPGTAPPTDSNPLTLGILFLTASYYIVYCTGLLKWLRKAQRTAGAKLSPGAPDGASSTSV
jgi:cytochrome b561